MKCPQPGCSGTLRDGYCDVCGLAATPSTPSPSPEPAAPVAADRPFSTSTDGLPTAPYGTDRAVDDTARRRPSRTTSAAARLGAGLTRVPTAPTIDPTTALLEQPEVPEHRRHCGRCGAAVGRGEPGAEGGTGDIGRSQGFCSRCGHPYSFRPVLHPGDLVAGQYEVRGALAHGGLGWIHLARDRNVSDRWVVLKGVLDTGDEDALAVAIAEQQFLAHVEHPSIVEIFNVVTHHGHAYTVMEYVGGPSLTRLLEQRRAARGHHHPFPVDHAIAYVLEVLPALAHLHDLGLLYCDLKPDNMIQVRDTMKLIDLGGVRRIDDDESPIYGTIGYQAPEIATLGPSVASDVYTVGRTLAVLVLDFRGYRDTFRYALPPATSTPLFVEHDSLHWFLEKCCAREPADRFTTIEELREQLLGVLRETVAREHDRSLPSTAVSRHFEPPRTAGAVTHWADLPRLQPDRTDPQFTWVARLATEDPATRLRHLETAPHDSAEVLLARGRAALEIGRDHLVDRTIRALLAEDPWEWRAIWLQGLAAIRAADWEAAVAACHTVHRQLPGELAPKLALALATERRGHPALAEHLHLTCLRTDPAYAVPAAFGLARVRTARGDHRGAAEALARVPPTSRGHSEARRRRADALLAAAGDDLAGIDRAVRSLEGAQLEPWHHTDFSVRALTAALAAQERGAVAGAGAKVGSWPATERGLRDGLEHALRDLARRTEDRTERIQLVNRANAVRNWSWR